MRISPFYRNLINLSLITLLAAGCEIQRGDGGQGDINPMGPTATPFAGIPPTPTPTPFSIPNPELPVTPMLPTIPALATVQVPEMPTAIPVTNQIPTPQGSEQSAVLEIDLPPEWQWMATPFLDITWGDDTIPTPAIPSVPSIEVVTVAEEETIDTTTLKYTGPSLDPKNPQDNFRIILDIPADGSGCEITSDELSRLQDQDEVRMDTPHGALDLKKSETAAVRIVNAYGDKIYGGLAISPGCNEDFAPQVQQ